MTDQALRFTPQNRAGWRRWLRANHAKVTGVWLVFLKGADRQLAYADAVEAMTIPPDFDRALAANTKAKTFFDALAPSSRKGILYWIHGVKSAELRAKRIAHAVSQSAKGLRPGHQEKWMAKTKAAAMARKKKR